VAAAGAITVEPGARTAAALTDAGRPDEAAEMVLRRPPLLSADGPDPLAGLAEQVRTGRPKVGLVAPPSGGGNWGSALLRFLGERFHTRLLAGGRIDGLAAFLDDCQIAWFEGCTRQVIVASKRPTAERRTIVHLPPADAFGSCVELVDWSNIDLLVTSGGKCAEDFLARRLPGMGRTGRIVAMPRGLDLAALGPPPRRAAQRGKHLACVDGLGLHGNAVLLLQCLRRLRQADAEYHLSFAGFFGDELLETRVTDLVSELGLTGAVAFDGWQEDLPAWLADKDYLVSAGMVEDDPSAVPLALATGIKPVLHVAGGSREAYGPELVYRSEEEFLDRIVGQDFPPAACQRLAAEIFPLKAALARANELVVSMEKELRDAGNVRRM
jgi:glycosyltransferase involved in cell wall biosynthesis